MIFNRKKLILSTKSKIKDAIKLLNGDYGNIIVPGTVYGYSDTYFSTELLIPGKGYWLRAFHDGEITIFNDVFTIGSQQDFSLNGKANTLSINGMDLYFGIDMPEKEKLSYSLPPKPPLGASDVRFKGNTRVSKENAEIEIMSIFDNVSISYNTVIDPGENMNWVLSSVNGDSYILEGKGEITVLTEDRFLLRKDSVIPLTFTLHQNYPNPFNPVTTLSYNLPKESDVRLIVYDILGNEVSTLVNSIQKAGFKSIKWDTRDSMSSSISAGIYIYQIKAGVFVQTKKMILLK